MDQEEKDNLKHTTEMNKAKTFKEITRRFLTNDQLPKNPGRIIRKGGAVPPTRVETPPPSPKPTKK